MSERDGFLATRVTQKGKPLQFNMDYGQGDTYVGMVLKSMSLLKSYIKINIEVGMVLRHYGKSGTELPHSPSFPLKAVFDRIRLDNV